MDEMMYNEVPTIEETTNDFEKNKEDLLSIATGNREVVFNLLQSMKDECKSQETIDYLTEELATIDELIETLKITN